MRRALSDPAARVQIGQPANCSSLGSVLNVLVWTQAAVGALWLVMEHRRRAGGPDGPGGSGGPDGASGDAPVAVRTPETEAAAAEAHLKITDACGLPCANCHVDPSAGGSHVPLADVLARLEALAARGVRRVALGGGEPLLHPELPQIIAGAAARGVSLGLTTSGVGLRAELLPALRGLALLSFSLDGLGETFRESRGWDGAARVLEAVRRAEGVRTGINLVLTRRALAGMEETVAAAAAAGAREIQLLRLKPVGRAAAGYDDARLTAEEGAGLWPRIAAMIARWPGVLFRADCAMVPFLSVHGLPLARLERFLIRGCQGGEALRSVGSDGAEHPCSFMPGPVTPQWRAGSLAEPCGSCAWQRVCRGGCHAVAAHRGDAFAPDPECPRVLQYQNDR